MVVLEGNAFHNGSVYSGPKKCDEESEAALHRATGRHRSPSSLFQALLYFMEVHVRSLDELQGHLLDVEELNDGKCHFSVYEV